jgi:S1-C subfamily serine protease
MNAFSGSRRSRSRVLITTMLASLWLVWPIGAQSQPAMSSSGAAEPRPVTPRGPLTREELATATIFDRASPSVVYITTVQHVRDYFSRNVMRVPSGTGSGFIWDEQGRIVTNLHVVRGATEAEVTLADQRTFPATLVGASADHDLAVLQIDVPDGLPPPLPIGASNDLRVGQSVLAIGNPFGLDHTLTTGIISALDRSIDNDRGGIIEHLIQTDAAINPGNSGGPLIDSAGRLIGINTAIYSPSGAYAGVGFAVPVDTINRVVPRLIGFGRYVRPSIGIYANDEIGEELLASLGIDGVLILGVLPSSPAERAGLRPTQSTLGGRIRLGDIVRSIDGHAVRSFAEMTALLDGHEVGDEVTIRIWRNGEELDLTLELVLR